MNRRSDTKMIFSYNDICERGSASEQGSLPALGRGLLSDSCVKIVWIFILNTSKSELPSKPGTWYFLKACPRLWIKQYPAKVFPGGRVFATSPIRNHSARERERERERVFLYTLKAPRNTRIRVYPRWSESCRSENGKAPGCRRVRGPFKLFALVKRKITRS